MMTPVICPGKARKAILCCQPIKMAVGAWHGYGIIHSSPAELVRARGEGKCLMESVREPEGECDILSRQW